MAEERPKRQRKVRSNTEFFGAGLLHKEEVELRRALNASLREVRSSHPKKEEKPSELATTKKVVCSITHTHASQKDEKCDQSVGRTRTVCAGTNTKFRIKCHSFKNSEKSNKGKGDCFKRKNHEREQNVSAAFKEEREVKPLKRKNNADISFCLFKKKKKEIQGKKREPSLINGLKVLSKSVKRKATADDTSKGGRGVSKTPLNKEMGITIAKKEFKSPIKTHKVCQFSGGKKSRILAKEKAGMHKSLQMKSNHKSKAVQSLDEKFSATMNGKLLSSEIKKNSHSHRDDKTCRNQMKKKNISVQHEVEMVHQESVPSEEDKNCGLRQQVSNSGLGKFRRRLKHKLKDRKLVCPLGEIYIPANVAKTEDFLTFLCLRGTCNSSLPRCFDVFKDPDPFLTQPSQQFPGDVALPCPSLPMQSSVIYSPPSSCTPSESSSATSPMSLTDGWIVNDD